MIDRNCMLLVTLAMTGIIVIAPTVCEIKLVTKTTIKLKNINSRQTEPSDCTSAPESNMLLIISAKRAKRPELVFIRVIRVIRVIRAIISVNIIFCEEQSTQKRCQQTQRAVTKEKVLNNTEGY